MALFGKRPLWLFSGCIDSPWNCLFTIVSRGKYQWLFWFADVVAKLTCPVSPIRQDIPARPIGAALHGLQFRDSKASQAKDRSCRNSLPNRHNLVRAVYLEHLVLGLHSSSSRRRSRDWEQKNSSHEVRSPFPSCRTRSTHNSPPLARSQRCRHQDPRRYPL